MKWGAIHFLDMMKHLMTRRQHLTRQMLMLDILSFGNFFFVLGANGITRTTPTCFLITFGTTFGEIFLKYSWKSLQKNLLIFKKISSYYFINVHVKNLVKNVIFKKIKIHLQVLLLFKNMLKCLINVFIYF